MGLPKVVKIIETRAAPNCRRVRIFLAEKGIDVPFEQINIMSGEHFNESHINKVGTFRVPVLELSNGLFLSESIAICRYFENENPKIPLFGRTRLEQAIVEMWQRRVEYELLWPIAFVLRHGNPKMAILEEQCEAWSVANKPRVIDGLKMLNQRVTYNRYVCGKDFTVADITSIVALDFLKTIKLEIPSSMEPLLNWKEVISQRSSMNA